MLETYINPSWGTDNWEKFQKLPSLAGHTLTYCPNTKSLILIGGHSTESGYNPDVLEYDLLQKRWIKVTTNGFGPRGIFGHSTIFSERTRSFHIFGGHVFNINESFISNQMWTLQSQSMTWSLMPFDQHHSKALYHLENRISPRYLHSAVAKEDYMVILGGDSHMAGLSVLLVFSFSCNQWLRIPTMVTREVRTHMRWQGQFVGQGLQTSQGANAVLTEDGRLLITGGLSQGKLKETLITISLPKDLCRLFDRSYEDCLSVPGCAMCRETQSGAGGMQGRCIFAENSTDLLERCPGPRHKMAQSWWCARKWVAQENRKCGSYSSCGECLATYPQSGDNSPYAPQARCQWCEGCDQGGRCIPRDRECNRMIRCYSRQVGILRSSQCPELDACSVPDCGKCKGPRCFWSKHVGRSNHQRKMVGGQAGDGWACENSSLLRHLDILNRSRPHQDIFQTSCPPACDSFLTCSSCLGAALTEAGHQSCWWSTAQQRCLSPVSAALLCVGGACGKLLVEEVDQCPKPCKAHTECSSCLAHISCGWCSQDLVPLSGKGFCSPGSLAGPLASQCGAQTQNGSLEVDSSADGISSWHFGECPLENECSNGHHSCDPVSQDCEDKDSGYTCHCKAGYVEQDGSCKPVCQEPCQHGVCTAPDFCSCHFAWTGAYCQLPCNCNGHSNCLGPEALNSCTRCENHTMGAECEFCLPGFVGDSRDGGRCVSCETICNGHTSHCFSVHTLHAFRNSSGLLFDIPSLSLGNSEDRQISEDILSELELVSDKGPQSKAETVCVNCGGGTRGPKCESCRQGRFRGSTLLGLPCRPCFCNLHGSQCDPVTGGDCNCQNHTTTEQVKLTS